MKTNDGDDWYSALHNKSIPLSNIHRQADRQKFSTYLLQAHEVRDYTVFSYITNTVILMGTTHGTDSLVCTAAVTWGETDPGFT